MQKLANDPRRRLQAFPHPQNHQNLFWKFETCWELPITRGRESSVLWILKERGDFEPILTLLIHRKWSDSICKSLQMTLEDDCKLSRTLRTIKTCSENSKRVGSSQLFENENPVYFGSSRKGVTLSRFWHSWFIKSDRILYVKAFKWPYKTIASFSATAEPSKPVLKILNVLGAPNYSRSRIQCILDLQG